MTPLTQNQRVLKLLQERRERGVTQADFLPPAVQGRPVARLAARVQDLRNNGHDIVTVRRPGQYAVYRLVEAGVTSRAAQLPRITAHEPAPLGPIGHAAMCALFGGDWEDA